MHLHLIRQDISGCQHQHPELEADLWSVPIDINDGEPCCLYAEFMPRGWPGLATNDPVILGLAFAIAGDTKLVPLPPPAATSAAGPYTMERVDGVSNLYVRQGVLLRLRVSGATLEPCLGAVAHMSVFELRAQGLTHLHAGTVELALHARLPNRGEYACSSSSRPRARRTEPPSPSW